MRRLVIVIMVVLFAFASFSCKSKKKCPAYESYKQNSELQVKS